MRGHGSTREKRENKRRALKKCLANANEKSAIANAKHRSAYKNVSLPTVNLPPERET